MAGQLTAAAGARAPACGARGSPVPWLLLAPATLVLIIMFVLPIGYVLLLSVTDTTFSSRTTGAFSACRLYMRVLLNTFTTSLTVTVACLLLGYPVAYVMSRRDDCGLSTVLLICVAVCFWTGFVVRTYAGW